MLINFPKMKFHLKAFSGQCTRLRAKLTSVRLSPPPPPLLVAGEEGKEIFPGTLVHIVIHAFAALCVRSFMHSFMRAFVSLTSCLLCVGYCLGHKNTKAELSPAIVQCLPEEANAQLRWKCAPHTQVCTGRVVHSIIQATMESCSDVDEALEAEQMWSRWVGRWGWGCPEDRGWWPWKRRSGDGDLSCHGWKSLSVEKSLRAKNRGWGHGEESQLFVCLSRPSRFLLHDPCSVTYGLTR